MVDHFRPSNQFVGPPWVDDRHTYAVSTSGSFFVLREMAADVANVNEAVFRARTRTWFDPDAFWVDLWPWRAGRALRARWIMARDRLCDVWWVLRHGMPETEDD